MKRIWLCAFASLAIAGAAPAAAPPPYIAQAVADGSRPKDDVAADALRDPADTLAFAGVKPGMVVGELFPGGGYFTRMLSDIVGPKGKVYGLENAGWKGRPPPISNWPPRPAVATWSSTSRPSGSSSCRSRSISSGSPRTITTCTSPSTARWTWRISTGASSPR